MYCLLGIALYSIYSTESTFESSWYQTIHVIKLIRKMSASTKANEFPMRERAGVLFAFNDSSDHLCDKMILFHLYYLFPFK